MDNAAYHKYLPSGTSLPYAMRKEEVLRKLDELSIRFDTHISDIEAKLLLKTWVSENVKPAVVGMAEEYGHEAVFTPPYHSDLQPIEILWAFIKGNIGRQCCMSTTLHQVENRLRTEF